MAEPGTIYEGMSDETPESFVASDTNFSKWNNEERGAATEAKGFLDVLKQSYTGEEATRFAGMLSTQVDDAGHCLGDSKLFVKAVASAARQVESMIKKRTGGEHEDGQKQIKYNMPLTNQGEISALRREARNILDRELMAARSEFIRRSGRSLPGWWR